MRVFVLGGGDSTQPLGRIKTNALPACTVDQTTRGHAKSASLTYSLSRVSLLGMETALILSTTYNQIAVQYYAYCNVLILKHVLIGINVRGDWGSLIDWLEGLHA